MRLWNVELASQLKRLVGQDGKGWEGESRSLNNLIIIYKEHRDLVVRNLEKSVQKNQNTDLFLNLPISYISVLPSLGSVTTAFSDEVLK